MFEQQLDYGFNDPAEYQYEVSYANASEPVVQDAPMPREYYNADTPVDHWEQDQFGDYID